MIVIRIVWVYPASYLPRLLFKSIRRRHPYPPWREVTVVAWTGMRGVVSLAAARRCSLDGITAARRSRGALLILFLTFVVILATLVLQGLTLPLLIRRLGIQDDRSMEKEEHQARLNANKAALAKLNEVAERDPAKADAPPNGCAWSTKTTSASWKATNPGRPALPCGCSPPLNTRGCPTRPSRSNAYPSSSSVTRT